VERKRISLGERWDMDIEALKQGGTLFGLRLPQFEKKSKPKHTKNAAQENSISDKTFEMARKLKGKRS